MKTPLDLLASCRAAKRESVMTKLACARRELDQALARLQLAQESVAQTQIWRAELAARCALGAQNVLRDSALPACIALLERQQKDLAQKEAMVHSANARVVERRQEMLQAERAVMRIDEWMDIRQIQERRDRSMYEDRQADELVHRRLATAGSIL